MEVIVIVIELDLHPHQDRVFSSPAKVKVLCAGRRFGKTVLASNMVVNKAFTLPESMSWVVSPKYSQTMIMWRMITKKIPKEYISDYSKSDLWLELENGSMCFAKSADNPDSLVGEGLDLCIVDEAARVKAEAWEVSLQPALMDKDGDALLISTPKGKNWFYQEWLRGNIYRDEYPEYQSFTYSSYDNPFLSPEVIKRMVRKLTKINYRQEILAEFIDDGGEVFHNVEACLLPAGYNAPGPVPGHYYVMGVDLAKVTDYTVIVVIDVDTRQVVYFRRLDHMDWSIQKKIITAVALKWNDATMLIDATGVGDPVVEDLQISVNNVRPLKLSNQQKTQIIEGLVVELENTGVLIPREPLLLGELGSFTYERLPHSGLIRYSAPSGFHDDCVIALALAVWGLEKEYGCRVAGTVEDFIAPKDDIDISIAHRSTRIVSKNPERLSYHTYGDEVSIWDSEEL